MEDSTRIFEYTETTECIVAQESTGRSTNRRSSILKPQKPRNPLQDLDFNPTLNDETTVTRKSRRVSFAAGSQVKEFHEVHTEVASVTVWGQSYEQTILHSGSGSDSSHHGDHTCTQGDCSNITNFDALVTGKIHISERNNHDDFENIPVDLRNNSGRSEVPRGLELQGNCNNAQGNGAGIDDRPLDLTLGTSRPASSAQKALSHSRYEGQIISGSMFQSEYSQHSIKTTFYGGDDEMDMSLSMREENDDLIANLFNKTGYVDDQDLSSSNEVSSPSGEQVNQQAQNKLHTAPQRQHFNNTAVTGNIDFTEPHPGGILQQSSNFKAPYAVERVQQAKLSTPFKSHVVCDKDMQKENTVFVSGMDFTEPVGVLFPLQSHYQREADKTLFDEKMDLTEGANGNTSSPFVEDHDMDVSSHDNYQSMHHSRNQRLDKTCYFDDMDMTKPVHTSVLESRSYNLDRTTYGEEMDVTRPVKAEMFEHHKPLGQLNKTAFDDEMDITGPVNNAMYNHHTVQLNKTAFVEEMEMTRPVNAALIEEQKRLGQLNKTAFVEEMEMTRPVKVENFEQKIVQLNKTAFVEEMEMTRPVNAAAIEQHKRLGQLNKTAFVEEMEMTRPVNAAMLGKQTVQLNKTAFVEEMEMTRPVNAALIEQHKRLCPPNKTAFVEEMEMTRAVNAALIEQHKRLCPPNKTAFVEEMEMTRPVNAALIEQHKRLCPPNKTAFVEEMEMTRPVNAALIEQHKRLCPPNKTAFVEEMEMTRPVNAALIEQHKRLCPPKKTAFVDDMEMTRPVNAALIEQHKRLCPPKKTAFVEEMEMTRPVNAALLGKPTVQLNKTTFVGEMEMTQPVNAANVEQQTVQLNKTVFVEEMEMTRPVNVENFEQKIVQLNKTAFVDDMEMTWPVNAAVIEQHKRLGQLNKTAFVEEMEMTRPVNAALLGKQTVQLNKTAFVDDMEMTRPVNAANVEQQTVQLNKTVFVDEMEITRSVDASMIEKQSFKLNQTEIVEEMDATKPASLALSEIYEKTLDNNKKSCFRDMFVQENAGKPPLPETHLQEDGKSYNIVEAVGSFHTGNLCSLENSTSSVKFSEQMATQGENPTKDLYFFDNNDVTEVTCTTFVNLPEIVSTQSIITTNCAGESKMPQNDRISVEETMDFIQVCSNKSQSTSEIETLERDIHHACSQDSNLGKQFFNKNESVHDVSERSEQSVNSSYNEEQISKSSKLQLSLSCTNSIDSDKILQNTLKNLNVLPVPELLSKPASETKVNTLEFVSSGLYSEKCQESLSTEFVSLVADKSLIDVNVSERKEFSDSNNEVHHSNIKRQLQSETPLTSEDLCSPPKLICVRTNEEQVLLVESQCNFQKYEVTEVSITDTSFPSYEEMDDSFLTNEANIDSKLDKMQDMQSFQEASKSHLDLLTDNEEKYDNSDKMVTAVEPKIKEPETIEEALKIQEKRSTEWTILELEELTWTFSFFCDTLDLVVKLAPSHRTSEHKVISIHFTSHRTEKSKDLCHLSHKSLMKAFPVEKMQSMCKSVSDVLNMLESISNESAKIKLFVDDFVFLQNSYGMIFKDDQKRAYVTVTSYPLFSFTCLTFNLEESWETFVPDDIEVANIVGKTVQSDVIQSLAKGVPAGPHCLKRLFLDIMKYIKNLEKFRPPGPLCFD